MIAIRRLFELRKEDHPVLPRMGPLFACVVGASVIIGAYARALFITHNDFAALPWMFIGASTFTALMSVAWVALMARLSVKVRFQGLLILIIVSFSILGVLTPLDPAGFSLVTFTWTTGLAQLALIQTWSYCAVLMPVRQARRLFPLFSGAGTAGAALGGALTTAIMEVAGLSVLVFVAVGVFTLAWFLVRWSNSTLQEASSEPGRAPGRAVPRFGVGRAIAEIRTTPLLLWLAVLVFAIQASSVILDFQFSSVLKQRYAAGEMASFLGIYYAIANTLSFLAAVVLGRHLSQTYGVGLTSSAGALVLLIGSTVAIVMDATGGLALAGAAIIGTSFAERIVGFGISKHALNAASTPLDAHMAERARFIIDGVVYRIATVGVSVCFLMVGSRLEVFSTFSPVVLVVSLVAVAAGIRVGAVYRDTLLEALRGRRVEPADRERMRRWAAQEAHRAVRRLLADRQQARRLEGLSLSEELELPLPAPVVGRLLTCGDPQVVAATLLTMAQLHQPLPKGLSSELLEPGGDVAVLRAALRGLDPTRRSLAPQVATLIGHEDPLVACMALTWIGMPQSLAHTGGVDGPVPTRRLPHLSVTTSAPDDAMLTVTEAPGEDTALVASDGLVSGALVERLMAFFRDLPSRLYDPSPSVRQETMDAMVILKLPALVGPLLQALDTAELRGDVYGALVSMDPEVVVPVLDRHLASDSVPMQRRVWMIRLAAEHGDGAVIDTNLGSRHRVVRSQAALSLSRLAREHPDKLPTAEALLGHARSELSRLVRYAVLEDLLLDKPWARLAALLSELAMLRANTEMRLFRVLAVLYPGEGLQRACLHYRSAFSRTKSNAIELVDATLQEPSLRSFVAYLEGTVFKAGGSRTADRDLLEHPDLASEFSRCQEAEDPIDAAIPAYDLWLMRLYAWVRSAPESRHQTTEERVMEHDVMERVFLLRRIPLFEGIPADQLLPVAEITEDEAFDSGEVIVREHEPGSHVYLIAQGDVDVFKGTQKVASLSAGECFGMMALLDDSLRSATVKASGEVHCMVIGREDFQDLLDITPTLARGIIRVLTRRLRETVDKSYA